MESFFLTTTNRFVFGTLKCKNLLESAKVGNAMSRYFYNVWTNDAKIIALR